MNTSIGWQHPPVLLNFLVPPPSLRTDNTSSVAVSVTVIPLCGPHMLQCGPHSTGSPLIVSCLRYCRPQMQKSNKTAWFCYLYLWSKWLTISIPTIWGLQTGKCSEFVTNLQILLIISLLVRWFNRSCVNLCLDFIHEHTKQYSLNHELSLGEILYIMVMCIS